MRRVYRRSWLAAVLLLAAPLAACGGGGDSDAFTFEDDELCDWLTADEIAGFFASVY